MLKYSSFKVLEKRIEAVLIGIQVTRGKVVSNHISQRKEEINELF